MSAFASRRPSPAFVLAAISLFVALGGTGYAATQLSRHVVAAAASKSKPLTKTEIAKLIKKYVTAHRSELTGPKGATGAAGGPLPIAVVGTSDSTQTSPAQIATVGPWSITMTCLGGNVAPSGGLSINGPGTRLASTTVGATDGSAGTTYEGGDIGAPPGAQVSEMEFLQSGSTVYQLDYNLKVVTSGQNVDCTVLGDAIKIS